MYQSSTAAAVPNLHYAKQHIQLLTGAEDTPVTFQTFPDSKEQSKYGPQIFHGTVEDCWPRIKKLISAGHGIFVMVNGGDFRGRSAKNVNKVRALFTDQEDEDAREYRDSFGPTFVIQSSRGPHSYWRLRNREPLDQFGPAQQQLAAHFKTDPTVKDLPRVMRLAGSLHQKDPAKPFLVFVKEANPSREYAIAEVLAAYPAPEAKEQLKHSRVRPVDEVVVTEPQRRRALGLLEWAGQKAGNAASGDRNNTLFRMSALVGGWVGGGYLERSRAESVLEGAGDACGLSWREVRAAVANGLDRGERDPQGLPDDTERKRDWMIARGLIVLPLDLATLRARRARGEAVERQ